MFDIEKQTIDVVKKTAPAVVSIVISKLMPQVKQMALKPDFKAHGQFGIPLPEVPLEDDKKPHGNHPIELPGHDHMVKVGGGSGFIVHPDGLILTNKHVVYETDAEYMVLLNDEREFPAKVLSRDPINDVAVLKIEASNLPIVKIGNSDTIELGQTVIAIGNALGLFTNTVSKGIVSGLGRKISASLGQEGVIENLRHVIQTDVAINQGNSGGPLVNLEGEVVGINTAIIFGAQNIGFALPINWAKRDLDDLVRLGRIIRPYIGLRYVMLDKELKEKYSLAIDYGALVIKDHMPASKAVVPGSPADHAGIKENDIILEINGEKLTEKQELADVVEQHQVGDEITLTVLRGKETLTTKTRLEERK
ncbi:MAG: hypothetical protein A3A33_00240 [Candidatus Yanofskybacteria bacterium RIFCSPLOWO2_01_FULL_49_25]|uniref:PDZ domain-containing protein n=1 Tax=Candidatus Yanofskybacteria bacterium RIFCSPLOWO2_01_FULL_49_25 TaxID=1802701 RepID=A0A1F8GUW1_9BACT|nr:MAG: hypothetical protein A3A33_00240 [Candidatus Yanofskybacteria bacterium RIFCSPLOWO2_01_FULL_49_25]